jgi:hypothetical protein
MNNPNQGGAAGGQDYLDKAFNAGAKKFGGAQGQKIAGNRAMSEKIVCTLHVCIRLFQMRQLYCVCVWVCVCVCV